MPITYAGGKTKHRADRVAKLTGRVAWEIWEMMKVDCPKVVRGMMAEAEPIQTVGKTLQTLQRAELDWVKTLTEQGMDRTAAELQARKWTSESLAAQEESAPDAGGAEEEETPDEEAFGNLAPAGTWGSAMELLFAGVDPGDLFKPEKRAAALAALAEYRKRKAGGGGTPKTT